MSKDWGWHFTETLAELLATKTGMAQGEKTDRKRVAKELIGQAILSHAPVINAEALAEKIYSFNAEQVRNHQSAMCTVSIAQLIADSIDLRLDWVDGKVSWGGFTLIIEEPVLNTSNNHWLWKVGYGASPVFLEMEPAKSQALAIEACGKALKRIITGVKE